MWHFDRTINLGANFLVKFALLEAVFVPALFLLRSAIQLLVPKQVSEGLAENNLTFIADGLELATINFFLIMFYSIVGSSESNLNHIKNNIQRLRDQQQLDSSFPQSLEQIWVLHGQVNNIEMLRANPRLILNVIDLRFFSFYTAQAALIKFVAPAAVPEVVPYATRVALLNATYDEVYKPMLAFYKSFPTAEQREARKRLKRMCEATDHLINNDRKRRNQQQPNLSSGN